MRGTAWTLEKTIKAIVITYWFSVGVQAGIIVTKHINECKCIKQKSCYMYHQTPYLAFKWQFLTFTLVWAECT